LNSAPSHRHPSPQCAAAPSALSRTGDCRRPAGQGPGPGLCKEARDLAQHVEPDQEFTAHRRHPGAADRAALRCRCRLARPGGPRRQCAGSRGGALHRRCAAGLAGSQCKGKAGAESLAPNDHARTSAIAAAPLRPEAQVRRPARVRLHRQLLDPVSRFLSSMGRLLCRFRNLMNFSMELLRREATRMSRLAIGHATRQASAAEYQNGDEQAFAELDPGLRDGAGRAPCGASDRRGKGQGRVVAVTSRP